MSAHMLINIHEVYLGSHAFCLVHFQTIISFMIPKPSQNFDNNRS